MDPVSLSFGAAGVLSLGLQSVEYLVKYYSSYKDRNSEIARTSEKLDAVLQTLETVSQAVHNHKWRRNEQTILENIEASIVRCNPVIEDLKVEVDKFNREPTDNVLQTVSLAGRRAAYPIRRSTLQKLSEDVSDLTSHLTLVLQALQVEVQKSAQADLEDMNLIIRTAQAHNLTSSLRHWLKAPDASVDYNAASSKRHGGTGKWLIKNSKFVDWLEQHSSFLWLYGFAGCGKTIICSTAIQYAFRRQRSEVGSAVAFFFFTFTDKSKQDVTAFLLALISQLCGQIPGIEADLQRLRDSCNEGMPSVPALTEHLRRCIERSHNVYILLDALDECPSDKTRNDVLTLISTMRAWAVPGLHLLVTSRDYSDIRQRLHLEGTAIISLQNQEVQQDIHDYIEYQVDNDPRFSRWSHHRDTIKTHLAERANGMFRWVDCQLGTLRNCLGSNKHLQNCLASLPQTLDKTYENMLLSIDNSFQHEAKCLLTLLCFSGRPLSVSEIIDALAIDIEDSNGFDPDSRLTDAEDLHRLCPGLIETYSRPQPWRYAQQATNLNDAYSRSAHEQSSNDRTLVRIAHFSIQEYLLSDRIQSSRASKLAISYAEGHHDISKMCLLYLCNDDFCNNPLTPSFITQYPLAKFAALSWYKHHCQCTSETKLSLERIASVLLTSDGKMRRWVDLYNRYALWSGFLGSDRKVKYAPAFYYAALLGLEEVLRTTLLNPGVDINTTGVSGRTALAAAASHGHTRAVQLLLDKGASIQPETGQFTNALRQAVLSNNADTVLLLLENGANPNLQAKGYGETRRIVRVKRDDRNTERPVGEDGSEPDIKSNGPMLLIPRNNRCDYSDLVELIQGKDGTNLQSLLYETALQVAAARDRTDMIKMLLKHGADINMKAWPHGTALQVAASNGCIAAIEQLLDHGADMHLHAGYNGTALQAAAASGQVGVIQLLLDKGVSIDEEAGHYGSALHAAAGNGQRMVVRLLLDKGANINMIAGHYGTVLQTAAARSFESVVYLLIDAGADIHLQSGHYGTLLQAAAAHCKKDVVQYLLEMGADINTRAGYYGTALQAATACSKRDTVQLLLQKGADTNAQIGYYGTALQAAAANGQATSVQLLLDAGADINIQAGYHGTALQAARAKRNDKMVQLLLDYGARD